LKGNHAYALFLLLQNGIVLGEFVPSYQHQVPQQIQSNSQTKPNSINFATNLNVTWRVYHKFTTEGKGRTLTVERGTTCKQLKQRLIQKQQQGAAGKRAAVGART
jgi:hypothetical protein